MSAVDSPIENLIYAFFAMLMVLTLVIVSLLLIASCIYDMVRYRD